MNDNFNSNYSHTNGLNTYGNNVYEDGELINNLLVLTLKENLHKTADESQKVVNFLQPLELQKIIPLEIGQEGCRDSSEINEIIDKVVKYSVRTTHPHFHNQLYGGLDEVALTSAWLLEALNTNQYTYEVAPVFVTMELYVIELLSKLHGWDKGDGLFSPGGSMSNMYGILLARHKKFPDLKETGYFGRKELVIFTSDQSHYSILKAANFMGFGSKQVVKVKSDVHGRMSGKDLLEAVQKVRAEGREPFFVNATAGTTVFGSYDPLDEIADICQKEKLWLHVDACWGGGVIVSNKYKYLMKGCERVDSISWNPHKMLCAPLQCSIFLVKHKGLLHDCNRIDAAYLFQRDKIYDVKFDLGDKSIQCGRKPDALKVWFIFKVHGLNKLGRRVEIAFDCAKYLAEEIDKRDGFRLVVKEMDCTNVCFWYIPPSFQNIPNTEDWWKKLHKVAPIIKGRTVVAGTLLVGYQPMGSKNLVNFFRMITTAYPESTKEHMDFVLDEIERNGKDIQIDQL